LPAPKFRKYDDCRVQRPNSRVRSFKVVQKA
jgi:hypothetical protein